jgi:hypothetical protein
VRGAQAFVHDRWSRSLSRGIYAALKRESRPAAGLVLAALYWCKGHWFVTRWLKFTVTAGALALVAPVAAQAPGLAMLGELERGSWQVRDRSDGSSRAICLGDPAQLLQLRHPRGGCSRYVISDTAGEVTVHYTCPGAGHGRTTIRRETNRLVQIDTQGLVSGAPFSDAFEARRTGPC